MHFSIAASRHPEYLLLRQSNGSLARLWQYGHGFCLLAVMFGIGAPLFILMAVIIDPEVSGARAWSAVGAVAAIGIICGALGVVLMRRAKQKAVAFAQPPQNNA